MSEFRAEKRVVVSPDARTLAEGVAKRFFQRISSRANEGKTTHVLLTGGTAGTSVLQAAGESSARHDVDWSKVHFWWGDERFVAADDPARNEVAARHAFLSHINVPEQNIHPISSADTGRSHDEAATDYAAELAEYGVAGQAWPRFTIAFLGVGPDGHIASLFPDRSEIGDTDHSVLAVRDSPVPPSDRITLTRPVINSSRRVWLVLPGTDKASALGLALAGASYHSVPAAGAKGRKQTVFFVDEAAAKNVPEELIDPEF
ncbi:6-phosphogluconolactonase [Microbacterium aquilitoris]|uniref:6-phosphogluconolactonase n=1 Tax=Microbacterium aquilitoris TaxID=3067307 RepID=UPI00288FC579|nr:6-phosphogluconolactonase [Microbacterium sp. KSW2-22]MDT3343656.1 6-phosphogluconolactonase [Microbacterium sp. KSW2-22]